MLVSRLVCNNPKSSVRFVQWKFHSVYVEIGAENNAQSFNVGNISKTYWVFNDPGRPALQIRVDEDTNYIGELSLCDINYCLGFFTGNKSVI